jgi:hypothetical protein
MGFNGFLTAETAEFAEISFSIFLCGFSVLGGE